MKVAITGGTGFVGAHSARAMLDAGHELRLLVHPDDRLDDALAAVGIDATDHEIV
ncbi:MAG: NAD-dependent epimerase/dehydratase family protein, partial [Acidimicrobiales bacterium]